MALDCTEPDAVLVATPPEAHRDAILAAKRDLPVLPEKPLAATLAEAVEILHTVLAQQVWEVLPGWVG